LQPEKNEKPMLPADHAALLLIPFLCRKGDLPSEISSRRNEIYTAIFRCCFQTFISLSEANRPTMRLFF